MSPLFALFLVQLHKVAPDVELPADVELPPVPPPTPSEPPPPPQPPETPVALPNAIGAREALILAEVAAGRYDHGGWWTVRSEVGGHTAVIPVTRRALRLTGLGGAPLTVSCSFTLCQQIADAIGRLDIPCCMPTSRVADLLWQQAKTRLPVLNQPTWVKDGSMAASGRLTEYSALLAARGNDAAGLIANEGKLWVVTRRFWLPPLGTGQELPEGKRSSRHNAANFGWYAPTAPSASPGGERVFQPIGLAHDRHHVDYSQLCTLMGRMVIVDGVLRDAADVMQDPALAPLLSDEGPLPALAHPDLIGAANV